MITEKELTKQLMKGDSTKLRWVNWLIVRVMNKEQRVRYAIFAAEQVLKFYEKKFPSDTRPRNAIEAAKTWLAQPTEENRAAADTASTYAASASAYAIYAEDDMAAAYAAAAAASAAYAAYAEDPVYAEDASSAAASSSAAYVYVWAEKARKAMLLKILTYGLSLLTSGVNSLS